MCNDSNHLTDLSIFLSKKFELSNSSSFIPFTDFKTMEEFRDRLAEKLAFLLDNKYDVLINILYRIDVYEDKLSELFAGQNKEHLPTILADLIIDRSLQKIRYRQKYKKGEL